MSYHTKCKLCDNTYHCCSSCGLTEYEEQPYEWGLCDSCWKKSPGPKLYLEWIDSRSKYEDIMFDYLKQYEKRTT